MRKGKRTTRRALFHTLHKDLASLSAMGYVHSRHSWLGPVDQTHHNVYCFPNGGTSKSATSCSLLLICGLTIQYWGGRLQAIDKTSISKMRVELGWIPQAGNPPAP